MWIRVTQKLPDGDTQAIRVNVDLVERVTPWKNGTMIIFQSGAQVELAETLEQWQWKESEEERRWTPS